MSLQPDCDVPPVTVKSIRLDSRVNPKSATGWGTPHLQEFLQHIRVLQSDEGERYGRRYQMETIRRGALQLPSPYTGELVSSTRSFVVNNGSIFYLFRGAPDFYVATSRISVGYPLAGLFLPASRIMLTWIAGGGPRSLGMRHLQTLITRQARDRAAIGQHRVIVVMGNPNFAHHLWNELSALENLVSRCGTNLQMEIKATREPLGRIEKIFPELAHLKTSRGKYAAKPAALYVNLASYGISEAVRNRLLQHARREASEEINALIRRVKEIGGPVFWLSVRTQVPTLENQREVIVAICRRLIAAYPRCSILLDGFSLPEDWSVDSEAASYRSSAAASRFEIDAIIGELSNANVQSSQLVVNIGGIRLLDSIALAELADVYFCHGGSVQHKIAWTANKPGIIHTSRTSKEPVSWHTDPLDGAVPPLPLPAQMIQNVEGNAREKNYRADADAVAQFVSDYFLRYAGR